MSYLKDFANELGELLEGFRVGEESKEDVIAWVQKKVYESWKNGVKKGSGKAKSDSKRSAKKEEEEVWTAVLMRYSAEGGNALRPLSPHLLTNHNGLWKSILYQYQLVTA